MMFDDKKVRFALRWTFYEVVRIALPIVILTLLLKLPMWILAVYMSIAYVAMVFLKHYSRTRERRRVLVTDSKNAEDSVLSANEALGTHPMPLRRMQVSDPSDAPFNPML